MVWIQAVSLFAAGLIVLLFAQGGRSFWRNILGTVCGFFFGFFAGAIVAAAVLGLGYDPRSYAYALLSSIAGCVGGNIWARSKAVAAKAGSPNKP